MCERVGLLQCFDMIFRYQKVKNLFALEFREAQCGHIRIIDTPVRYGNEELNKHATKIMCFSKSFKTKKLSFSVSLRHIILDDNLKRCMS